MSVMLITDVFLTVLVSSTSGVFTKETFDLSHIASAAFFSDGKVGIIRFLVFVLVCAQTWLVEIILMVNYCRKDKSVIQSDDFFATEDDQSSAFRYQRTK